MTMCDFSWTLLFLKLLCYSLPRYELCGLNIYMFEKYITNILENNKWKEKNQHFSKTNKQHNDNVWFFVNLLFSKLLFISLSRYELCRLHIYMFEIYIYNQIFRYLANNCLKFVGFTPPPNWRCNNAKLFLIRLIHFEPTFLWICEIFRNWINAFETNVSKFNWLFSLFLL